MLHCSKKLLNQGQAGDNVGLLLPASSPTHTTHTTTATSGVEMFKKLLNQGQAGDNVGLLLRGLKREDIVRGQLIAKPGTVKTHKNFEAEVSLYGVLSHKYLRT